MDKIGKALWNALLAVMEFVIKKVLRIELTEKQWENFLQFVKFGLVGVSNTVIAYVVYVLVLQLKIHYVIANMIGFFISVINAFYWNNKFVFKSEEGEHRSIWKAFLKTLISYSGTGVVLANILLVLWVEIVHLPKEIAPIINLLITIPLNFLLNKFWAFLKKSVKKEEKRKN